MFNWCPKRGGTAELHVQMVPKRGGTTELRAGTTEIHVQMVPKRGGTTELHVQMVPDDVDFKFEVCCTRCAAGEGWLYANPRDLRPYGAPVAEPFRARRLGGTTPTPQAALGGADRGASLPTDAWAEREHMQIVLSPWARWPPILHSYLI